MSPRFAFTPIPPTRAEAKIASGVAALAGPWRGQMVDEDGNSQVFSLLRNDNTNTSVAGRFLFFVTRDIAPTGVRLLEASSSAFVALVGPVFDPQENAEIVIVFEGRRVGTGLEGAFYTRLFKGGVVIRSGTFSAARVDASFRAA